MTLPNIPAVKKSYLHPKVNSRSLMRGVAFISFFLVMGNNFTNAQHTIQGTFNPVSKTFETNDKTYWIDFFEKGIARIYKEGYVGLADSTGTVLCEPKYDAVSSLEEGVYRVSLNNKLGLINNKGHEILAPFTSQLSDFKSGLATYMQRDKNGYERYGLLKKDGTFLTKAVYVLLLPREGSGYLFTKNDQAGFIDYNGKEHIAYTIKDLNEAVADNVIRLDQGIISKPENCFPKGYFNSDLLKFDEGLAITFKKEGECYKYGFMDTNFQTVITPKYDWVEKFINGFAVVSNKEKWGLIDAKGNQVIPCKYDQVKQSGENRFIVSLNNKYGVIDSKNKVIISIKYHPIFGLKDHLYATHDGKKWGVIDENEKQILPFEYDGINPGMATKYAHEISLPTNVPRQTLYGTAYYFDTQGKINKQGIEFSIYVEGGYSFLSDPAFFSPLNPSISLASRNQALTARINEKYAFREQLKNGFAIVGVKDTVDINQLLGGIYNNRKYYKKGITDPTNQIIVPLMYDDIENNLYDPINLFASKLNGKYGVIDLKNNIIIPFEYDYIKVGNGFFIIRKQTEAYKWEYAVYDFFGKELIPFGTAGYDVIGNGVLQKKEGYHHPYFTDKKGNPINIE